MSHLPLWRRQPQNLTYRTAVIISANISSKPLTHHLSIPDLKNHTPQTPPAAPTCSCEGDSSNYHPLASPLAEPSKYHLKKKKTPNTVAPAFCRAIHSPRKVPRKTSPNCSVHTSFSIIPFTPYFRPHYSQTSHPVNDKDSIDPHYRQPWDQRPSMREGEGDRPTLGSPRARQ